MKQFIDLGTEKHAIIEFLYIPQIPTTLNKRYEYLVQHAELVEELNDVLQIPVPVRVKILKTLVVDERANSEYPPTITCLQPWQMAELVRGWDNLHAGAKRHALPLGDAFEDELSEFVADPVPVEKVHDWITPVNESNIPAH